MKKHLKDLLESNTQLKKENAEFRRDHMIPLGRVSKSKKLLYNSYVLSWNDSCSMELDGNHVMDAEVSGTEPDSADDVDQDIEATQQPSISAGIFSHSLSCPVELDSLLTAPNVQTEGHMIVLPPMPSIQTNHSLPLQDSSNEIML